MNQNNLEKWLADLETTDQPQTQSALRDAEGYCCLGRLCEVAIADGTECIVTNTTDTDYFNYEYDGSGSMPPESIRDWLGELPEQHFLTKCAELNDDYYLSFKEIARRIRQALDPTSEKGLFDE